VVAFILGRWLRFAQSGFRRLPTELLDQQIAPLIV
jgi:hypothetical protein